MSMARRVAELYHDTLRYEDGAPVECVLADTTIGGVAEAAAAAEKFRNSGVGAVLSVTPCWCYGAETIDMDPLMPKAIWGFNGTERPGAVYLASALAGHNQKGLPAFGIYGRDVQDLDDRTIPADVREKLLRFGRAAVAVMQLRGKSYLSIGSVSMGIAGSMPDASFFQEYLDMRNEAVDCSEIERRIELGIYDHEEYERAMAWVERNCKSREGKDCNPAHLCFSREEKDAVWAYVVKMTMIFRDLMQGNPVSPAWASRRRLPATTPSPADSRASASGPTSVPTATSRRPSSIRRSTGTASAARFPSLRRMTRSTA